MGEDSLDSSCFAFSSGVTMLEDIKYATIKMAAVIHTIQPLMPFLGEGFLWRVWLIGSDATGAPQPGQLTALSDISRPHSLHGTNAMGLTLC